MSLFHGATLAPTLLLILACAFDLKSGKFPNWLFVVSSGVALLLNFLQMSSLLSLIHSLMGALILFCLLVPFVFKRAFGAGDAKLMAAFCLFTSFSTGFSVVIYSLFWGLLIGIFRLCSAGEMKTFAQAFILKTPQTHVHKIPYTFALLLGWLSFLSRGGFL